MAKKEMTTKDFLKGVGLGVAALAIVFALEGGDQYLQNKKAAAEQVAAAEAAAAAAKAMGASGSYTAGTYTASAKGMESDVTVTMTFDETNITNVEVDSSGETPDIGAAAADDLASAILTAQSDKFDGVSGATVTSDAARAAAAACIAQASGEEVPAAETEAAPAEEAATEAVAPAAEAAGEEAATEAAAPAAVSAGAAYVPGTYTATAKGLESDVTATLTFDETSITDVVFDVSGETQGIGTETGEPLAAAILEAQSAEVDVVAGASITSGAALEAAADCIAQASGSAAGEAVEAATEAVEAVAEAAEAVTEAAEEVLISETEIMEVAEDPVGAAAYVPGTYTAAAKGLESDVTATLTFDESSITDVVFDVSGETKGIGTETGEPLAAAILDAQSAEVDVIAGASITSGAALEAAADCIAQASGSAAGEAVEAATEAIEAAQAVEAATEAVEAVEAATEAVEAVEAATEAAAGALYVPGTYTATAKGLESDVTATLTFDESAITDVSFDVSGETKGIGTETGEPLAAAILEAQNAEVDVIAGASITSGAALEAAADCIAQALTAGEDAGEEAVTEAAAAGAAGYTPGTYTATAKGLESDVTATLTFDETSITDVSFDVSGETKGIGTETGEPLAAAILDAQSAQVDVIAGASITSGAALEAAADCIAQAAK